MRALGGDMGDSNTGVFWNKELYLNDSWTLTAGVRYTGGFNFRNASPDIIPPGPTREEENSTFEVGLKVDFEKRASIDRPAVAES